MKRSSTGQRVITAAVILTATVLAVWCAVIIFGREKGDTVNIMQDGKTLYTLDMSREKDRDIEVVYEGRKNVIRIEDGEVFMLSADCPDHVCINTGKLRKGTPIICLPNRLVVEYADSGGGDAAAG